MTSTTIQTECGISTTGETYIVFYDEHDSGAQGGLMVREGLERAERTANLLRECGYQLVNIRNAKDLNE